MAAREYGTDPYGIIQRGVPSDDGGASLGKTGAGTYGVRFPMEGGGRFGIGLGSGAVGGGGATFGAGMKIPLGKQEATDIKKKAKGGKVKKMAKGGSTASKRADGCAVKGKTKGRMV
jgi:hypothetical protein